VLSRQSEANWAELTAASEAAMRAGQAIMHIYTHASSSARSKTDGSPVTDADLASDRVIRAVLGERFPGDPILTEEGQDDIVRLRSARCWIVDPLDGTKQFLARTGVFDVLVALVVDGRPVVGVTCHPPTGALCGAALGAGAWTERDHVQTRPRFVPSLAGEPLRLVTSVWYDASTAMPALRRVAARLRTSHPHVLETNVRPLDLGSAGAYDAFVGLAPTDYLPGGEWDFAALDVIISEAGGAFTDLWGNPHRYNKPVPRNRGGLLVTPDPPSHARMLDAV
jgi:3'(2'), 5'-bisphosphate nucleotidase